MERFAPYEWIVQSESRDDVYHWVTLEREAIREFTTDDRNPQGLSLPGFCSCEHYQTRILPPLRKGRFLQIKTCQHIRDVRENVLNLALAFLNEQANERHDEKRAA